MKRLVLSAALSVAFAVVGCMDSGGSSQQTPQLTGDACAVHMDETACVAESGCSWYAYGRPCPDDGSYCPAGVCQGDTGSGSGSGSGSAACACPEGGVCFEQLGGTPQPSGSDPGIQCTTPAPGDGDPCARIEGQGTCSASPTVGGLCMCRQRRPLIMARAGRACLPCAG